MEPLRIMLVDDDDAVRDAVAEVLSRRGWTVEAFDTAEAGIASLNSGHYDIVLADINMPGLSGMDFLHMAKEAAPDVPIVMITGYPSIDLAVEAMKVGAVDFLAKPFKTEELEITIRKAVDGREVRGNKLIQPVSSRPIGRLPEVARRRLEDKIKELSILHTISEALDDVNEKDDIFRKTMDIGQIIADSDKAFIMVIEQDSCELVVSAASGYESQVIGTRFRLKDEPFKSVIKNKCYSYLLVDQEAMGPLVYDGGHSPHGRKPLLLAPMMINREVVVLLGLTGKDSSSELNTDVMALLMNLTAKASLKIENIALSENIFSSIIGALNSLLNALDARDTYTKDHSNRVTQYAIKIARALKCEQDVLDSISFAGPLHDIGKIGVRDEILLKKGQFTVDERETMKSHVIRGEEILRPLNLLTSEKSVVLYHHERWDGGGYPNGLSREDIPVVARIFSVADTFDAMTSTRPYRNALSFDVAREEIVRCKGTQFDPDVVDAFLESEILKV